MLCSIDPVHGPVKARGMCHNCYMREWYRLRRWGDAGDLSISYQGQRNDVRPSLKERLLQHSEVDAAGCRVWRGAYGTSKSGRRYGHVQVDGKPKMAHRAAYEEWVGPIPDRFVIDHLCGNSLCIEPEHLEAVPNGENIRRGGGSHFDARGRRTTRAGD